MAKSDSELLAFLYDALETPFGIVVEVEPGRRHIAMNRIAIARRASGDPTISGVEVRRAPQENEIWIIPGPPKAPKGEAPDAPS